MIDIRIPTNDECFIVKINTTGIPEIPEYENNHNIYKINKNNEIIWQIQAESTGFDRDSFVYVSLWEGYYLSGTRFSGFNYDIDIETGKAKKWVGINKRY